MMTRKKKYQQVAISPQLHRGIAITAAQEGISRKELAERLFRLGLMAPDLAAALRDLVHADAFQEISPEPSDDDYMRLASASLALAAYEAAITPQEESR